MTCGGVDPLLLNAWLSARSIARGLPMPVPEHGGFRVDTNADDEIARWVFPKAEPRLTTLAQTISEPGYLLKLCGSADELSALLPVQWTLHHQGYFMQASAEAAARRLAVGYQIRVRRDGAVTHAQIFCDTGELAAEGYAAETADVFIYDRIITQLRHRRKGLAQVLIANLYAARQIDGPQVLVATEAGRVLYSALGWETVSPYSTASISRP